MADATVPEWSAPGNLVELMDLVDRIVAADTERMVAAATVEFDRLTDYQLAKMNYALAVLINGVNVVMAGRGMGPSHG